MDQVVRLGDQEISGNQYFHKARWAISSMPNLLLLQHEGGTFINITWLTHRKHLCGGTCINIFQFKFASNDPWRIAPPNRDQLNDLPVQVCPSLSVGFRDNHLVNSHGTSNNYTHLFWWFRIICFFIVISHVTNWGSYCTKTCCKVHTNTEMLCRKNVFWEFQPTLVCKCLIFFFF